MKSLAFPRQLSNSLTFLGFPDKLVNNDDDDDHVPELWLDRARKPIVIIEH